jgi:Arc/MetJ-type ribon-helix-helix transcriptional regulator
VRLPEAIVAFIDSHLDYDEFANRSDFLQHWAAVGVRVMSDPELREALDWALDQERNNIPTPEKTNGQVDASNVVEKEEAGTWDWKQEFEPLPGLEQAERENEMALAYNAVSATEVEGPVPNQPETGDLEMDAFYGDMLDRLRSRVR